MIIRLAVKDDLNRINELRKQVNDLHVEGRPETFKAGFPEELRDHIHTMFNDPDIRIIVCEIDGETEAFAVLNHIRKPETPYMFTRDYLDIDEFCVDEKHRRMGIGRELIGYIREYAITAGFDRVELNMWEFNRDALDFYESVGFKTYRRYMELECK